MPDYKLWCYIEGQCDCFKASISLDDDVNVYDLKKGIFAEGSSKNFAGYSAKDLTLTKVCYIMISM